MTSSHKWFFKPKLRTRAFGWRGSNMAFERLREAVSEIRAVGKSNPVLAADGVVTLAERLWPALQNIDTSSGALGGAVNRTLEALLPILIDAPADVRTRTKWLERLFQAVQEDGVEYLMPIEERWGEIAVYPEHMITYADLLLPTIRRVWNEEKPGGHVVGTAICLSSLLEVGRYGDLLELLSCAKMRWWSWHRFGADALSRQGLWQSAITYAESCRDSRFAAYDDRRIDRYCERVLREAGRIEQAYQQYGLTSATGPTFLAVYRETVRGYPEWDKRQTLLDLIETRGQRGKWFAAAKSAGFLDIAIECAKAHDVEPATLVRAARDFAAKKPSFAAQIALLAISHLIAGRGYEPDPALVRQAVDHLLGASSQIDARQWAMEQLAILLQQPGPSGQDIMRRCLAAKLNADAPVASSHKRAGSNS